MSHVFADDDAHGARGAASGKPVAPADDETGIVADGAPGEIVLAAAFGNCRAQFGELEGTHQGVEGAAKPHAEKKPVIGKARGDIAGRAHDAGGNGVADRDRDAKAYAEDLQELAAFLARVSGPERLVGGKRVRGSRQCAVSGKASSLRAIIHESRGSKIENRPG